MKKTSLFLVVLAMIAVLFGCDASFQLKGSTYTNTDTDNSIEGRSSSQQVTVEFSKKDTGKITSKIKQTSGETTYNYTYTADFSWVVDGNIVTITGSSYTDIYSVEGDPTSMTTQHDTPFSITATIEEKVLTISYPYGEETLQSLLSGFFSATYSKWDFENVNNYGLEYDKWPPFTVNLSKN